jgi:hypothetical protein
MTEADRSEPVGTVAEEAAKLFGALSGRAHEHREGVSTMAGSMAGRVADLPHEHLAPRSPDCTWCPLCRTVVAMRETSPEVRARLADTASPFMLAVSGMTGTNVRQCHVDVERIDLDDDTDWPEDRS